jgi:hypothetical protein
VRVIRVSAINRNPSQSGAEVFFNAGQWLVRKRQQIGCTSWRRDEYTPASRENEGK